ncbi:hypothetical protein SAMN04488112_104161 [Melghirimyces thermohalophilus]|uniref:Uncharacterized protein n=1 Tax=Melghirimyces thermohalophilus TaxID=1236220 RepID=A0A1G6JS64_9BACL|nr:hypothetical protein SAMN04488112_104161 [Melghirimyces thermohalophilus]
MKPIWPFPRLPPCYARMTALIPSDARPWVITTRFSSICGLRLSRFCRQRSYRINKHSSIGSLNQKEFFKRWLIGEQVHQSVYQQDDGQQHC